MAEWVAVARVEEIPPGGFRVVNVDGTMVALFNLNGEYHAIDDVCTHDGGSLSGGEVQRKSFARAMPRVFISRAARSRRRRRTSRCTCFRCVCATG